jgi:phospholipase C
MKRLIALLALCLLPTLAFADDAPPPGLGKVQHIVVLYLENHSFDNLYGLYPGANGLENAKDAAPQVDAAGQPYATLPPVLSGEGKPAPDPRFPPDLPNAPFSLMPYLRTGDLTADMKHRFYQEQAEINGGKMDGYVRDADAGALPMGYYDGSGLPLWKYAQQYALGDNYFHGAFGGSFLNHFWLVCACTPVFPNPPDDLVAKRDGSKLLRDGAVTPDGFAVNTLMPFAGPRTYKTDDAHALPLQTMPTIGDRLSEKGVDWAWYGGGYNDAMAGHPAKLFEVHHQPFLYFANYARGSDGAAKHLKDEADFVKAIDTDSLPPVSFWKPFGEDDEHPGYASVLKGDQHTADILDCIRNSPEWAGTLVIVTYDENGGQWDHAAPPARDKWGPGTRVPLIVVSPFARPGMVDHTQYDTLSILKLIELRYGLAPLTEADAKAAPMLGMLDFSR